MQCALDTTILTMFFHGINNFFQGDVTETTATFHVLVQTGAPIEMLQSLVDEASANVDRRLKGIMMDTFGFKRHCLALKQYLFFSQGDFVSALLHQIADSLTKKASQVRLLTLFHTTNKL